MPTVASLPSRLFQGTADLNDWLLETGSSLVVAIPRHDRLGLLRPHGDSAVSSDASTPPSESGGGVHVELHRIDRPTRLLAVRGRLFLSTDHQIHEFADVLAGDATYKGHDRAFVLRRTHTVGDVGIHNLREGPNQSLRFLAGRYNTLAALDDTHSFRSVWRLDDLPKGVSGQDHRLTGMALDTEGRPRFATVDTRDAASNGSSAASGGIVDVEHGTDVASGLPGPIHPVLQNGTLYFVTRSDRGLWTMPGTEDSVPKRVATVPGHPVDMQIRAGCAIISKSATPHDGRGDGVRDALQAGLTVVRLSDGAVVAEVQTDPAVGPLSGVALLEGARSPALLSTDGSELRRTVTFRVGDGAVYHRLPEDADGSDEAQDDDEERPESTPPEADVADRTAAAVDALDLSDARRRESRVPVDQPYAFMTGTMRAADLMKRFKPLLPSRFVRRVRSQAIHPQTPLFGALALMDKQPVGIAAATRPTRTDESQLHALSVVPPQRGQGVATALLNRLEPVLAEQGAERIEAQYRESNATRRGLERVFEKCDWNAPRTVRRLYKGQRKNVPEAFIKKLAGRRMQTGESFPWGNLTTAEREDLQARLDPDAERSIPRPLSPFQLGDNVDYDCSLGLRYDGRVAGWMITHRLKPEVLQYTCLYVEPEIRGPGVGLSLLARAILRQAEETDIPRFIWMVDAEHTRMHRFLSSRFASIIDTEDALLESAKQL